MDENKQNQPTVPPQPKSKSLLGIFALWGGVVAAVGMVLEFVRLRRNPATTEIRLHHLTDRVLPSAILAGLLSLIPEIDNRLKTQKNATPPTPPTPPAFGERPNGLGLATIPQILDILAAQGDITAEQHTKILADIKGGRKGFAAQMAVEDGFTTAEKADAALAQQGMMKAEAAVSDIQNIKDYGSFTAPAFLKANWGNNGVNPAAAAPTRTDGISAAANAAQNLVMLANANPALAPQLFNGVIAAASLANGIANGDSPVTPIAKMSAAWQQTMNDALVAAAAASPQAMVDANGKPINVQDFIAARGAEISAAVAETLRNPPQQDKGTGRQ